MQLGICQGSVSRSWHIFAADISQMVTRGQNIAIATTVKLHMTFPLAYLQLAYARSKVKSCGGAHFDSKCLENGRQIEHTLLLATNRKSYVGFRFSRLKFDHGVF